MSQTFAHQVEVAQDVGGTLHIEPDDMPRAGEEVLAWFALTRKGGQPISLAECDCQVNIYRQPELGDDTPIFSSAPLAVKGEASAKGADSIPGIKFTFPEVGTYKLVISGQARAIASDSSQTSQTSQTSLPASFAPFELAFDVTVATGKAIPTIPADDTAALPAPNLETSPPQTTETALEPNFNRQILPWIGVGTASILLGWGANLLWRRR